MNTRKSIAELAAMLAQRNSYYNYAQVAADALKLARLARAAQTGAVSLCNISDYQARYNTKAKRLHTQANAIAIHYALRAKIGGDPRGSCLHLHSTDAKRPLPGNTFGGDEAGFGV